MGWNSFWKENGLAGTEVFMNYEGNRSQSLLFDSEAKKAAAIEKYQEAVCKAHTLLLLVIPHKFFEQAALP